MTVVFATRNRAPALAGVLDAFASLTSPDGGWKLIVVDNGSSDGTAVLLAGYADRLDLTVLCEPVAGKNRALNLALPYLEGILGVFTDDDVLPRPDWLIRFLQAAADHPEASLFGGTIVPHWGKPRPSWLTDTAVPFTVLYSQQTRDAGPCSYDAIFGPSMAIRKGVFDTGVRFSEAVGPNESRHLYAMGSETELLRRLETAGHRGWFVSEAVVEHIIRPEQLDEAWILKRGYRYGSGEGRHYIAANPGLGGALRWLGVRQRLRVRALVFAAASWLIGVAPPSALRLKIRYKASTIAGAYAGLAETLRNAK